MQGFRRKKKVGKTALPTLSAEASKQPSVVNYSHPPPYYSSNSAPNSAFSCFPFTPTQVPNTWDVGNKNAPTPLECLGIVKFDVLAELSRPCF